MTLQEFDRFVKRSPSLSILGADEQLEKIWIQGTGRNPKTRIPTPMTYEVKVADLPRITETQAELNLHGKSTVKHISRVVGYWANTENWNRSKISELKDRGKGNYEIR